MPAIIPAGGSGVSGEGVGGVDLTAFRQRYAGQLAGSSGPVGTRRLL